MSPLSQNVYNGSVRNWKSMLYLKEKEREPFKTLTLADTQEDPDLAKALELSLQEANERAQV